MKLLTRLGLLVGMLVAVRSIAPAAETDGSTPSTTWTYKTVGDVTLRLHVFLPPGHQASDRRPAIVLFFGGAWNNGSPSQFYPHCQYLASRGMVAISADYRVKTRNQTSPRECVMDGKSALRWVRAHATEHGIDPQRIAAGGGSAGGHVAAAVALVNGFEQPGEDTTVNCRPDALVLFNPVFDNGPTGWGHERVKEYWREFSPLHNIRATAPPTVVFLGSKDALVPVATAEDYQRRMAENGRRCDLHVYPGQAHGFFNYKNTEYYEKTVIEADRFLASLGYLQGEPTLKPTR